MNLRRQKFELRKEELRKERIRQAKSIYKKPAGANVTDINKHIKEQYKKETKMGGVIKRIEKDKKNKDIKIPPPLKLNSEIIENYKKIAIFNPNRTCIINQFAGLGDIIMCEPIARMYHEMGYKILWPVMPYFTNINKHFAYITFVDKSLLNIDYNYSNFSNINGTLILPLRFSDSIMNVPYADCMKSKYMMFNLPFKTWRNVQWTRDVKAEKELFYDVLKLSEKEPYNLISNTFKSDFSGHNKITPSNNFRNIKVEKISNYSLIDWGMVIENATNIYTVGSSINCIIEKLEIKAKEYHLFPRMPDEKDCKFYEYFIEKPHITHIEEMPCLKK